MQQEELPSPLNNSQEWSSPSSKKGEKRHIGIVWKTDLRDIRPPGVDTAAPMLDHRTRMDRAKKERVTFLSICFLALELSWKIEMLCVEDGCGVYMQLFLGLVDRVVRSHP